MDKLKAFSIIEDEDKKKRIVPSSWLNSSKDRLKWPPYEDPEKIHKSIVYLESPNADWMEYECRFVKDKADYVTAAEAIKQGYDEFSSDAENLKKSRRDRKRKKEVSPELKHKYNRIVPRPADQSSAESSDEFDQSQQTETSVTQIQNGNASENVLVDGVPCQNKANETTHLNEQINTFDEMGLHKKLDMIYELSLKCLRMQKLTEIKLTEIERRLTNIETAGIRGNNSEKNTQAITEMAAIFPIINQEKMSDIEEKLESKTFFNNMARYMVSIGGVNAHDLIYNILRTTLDDGFASTFSFYGQKKKKSFSQLRFNSVIFGAVRTSHPNATTESIISSIRGWLDNSTTRSKRATEKVHKRNTFIPFIPEEN